MSEPSVAYELIQELSRSNDRLEKTNKRLFIIIIILVIVIISMFVGFLIYKSQFEYVSSFEQTQEVNGSEDITQNMNKGE